jgi:hypothetical protein
MQRSIGFFVVLFCLLVTACGGSGNNSDPPSASIAGNWQMSLQPADQNESPRIQSGFLVQNGNTLGGQLMLTDPPCSGTGAVSGSVDGGSVAITVNLTGISVSLNGTLGSGPNSMSGNYTILSTGCTGNSSSPETGTWTANLVTPLSGNFQGSFTFNNGTGPFSVTGTVSQGANTGSANALLSGTLDISNSSNITPYCFGTAPFTVSGVVSGTSVVMNVLDSIGNQFGQIYGTSSITSGTTSVTGKIGYLGQGPTGTKGCKTGANGPITLTW